MAILVFIAGRCVRACIYIYPAHAGQQWALELNIYPYNLFCRSLDPTCMVLGHRNRPQRLSGRFLGLMRMVFKKSMIGFDLVLTEVLKIDTIKIMYSFHEDVMCLRISKPFFLGQIFAIQWGKIRRTCVKGTKGFSLENLGPSHHHIMREKKKPSIRHI